MIIPYNNLEVLNYMKKNKRTLIISSIILLFICALLYKALIIENERITVRKEIISTNKLDKNFDGFTIALISDLHFDNDFNKDNLHKIITKVNNINPDVLIFGGDLLKYHDTSVLSDENQKLIIEALSNLKAKYGKYAIYGDQDLIKNTQTKELVNAILNQADFHILTNNRNKIYKNNSYINIIGINPDDGKTLDIKTIYNKITTKEFNLTITHFPDIIDYLPKGLNDLILAAHSHGGYIALPFTNGLIKTEGANKYVSGKYYIDNTIIDISNGLGNDGYPVRFNTPKEILVYKIQVKK